MFQVFADSMMVATRLETEGRSHSRATRPHHRPPRSQFFNLIFGSPR